MLNKTLKTKQMNLPGYRIKVHIKRVKYIIGTYFRFFLVVLPEKIYHHGHLVAKLKSIIRFSQFLFKKALNLVYHPFFYKTQKTLSPHSNPLNNNNNNKTTTSHPKNSNKTTKQNNVPKRTCTLKLTISINI